MGERGAGIRTVVCLLGRGASAARWASVARREVAVVGRSEIRALVMSRKAIPRNKTESASRGGPEIGSLHIFGFDLRSRATFPPFTQQLQPPCPRSLFLGIWEIGPWRR